MGRSGHTRHTRTWLRRATTHPSCQHRPAAALALAHAATCRPTAPRHARRSHTHGRVARARARASLARPALRRRLACSARAARRQPS
eukprot:5494504-Prymnesium_polylepis.1